MRPIQSGMTRRVGRRRLLAATGALGVGAFMAACGGGKQSPAVSAPASDATAASAPPPASGPLEPAVIGLLTDKSGPIAPLARPAGEGMADILAFASATGLAKRAVRVVEIDYGYQTDKGREGYQQLRSEQGIVGLLPLGTPITDALIPLVHEDKIPIWTPGFGVGAAENGARYPYAFIGGPSYPAQAAALLRHFKDKWDDARRPARVAYLYYGNAAGRDPLETIRQLTPKLGLELVLTLEAPTTATDLTAQYQEVREKEPDYLLTHFFGLLPATSMKTARAVGFNPEKYYSLVWGTGELDYALAGGAGEGTYGLHYTAMPADNPEILGKLQAWLTAQGRPPDENKLGLGAVYYTRGVYGGALVLEAVNQAEAKRALTGADVRLGSERVKDFDAFGLGKGVTLTPTDHAGTRKVRLYQVKNGKQTLVRDWFEGPKLT